MSDHDENPAPAGADLHAQAEVAEHAPPPAVSAGRVVLEAPAAPPEPEQPATRDPLAAGKVTDLKNVGDSGWVDADGLTYTTNGFVLDSAAAVRLIAPPGRGVLVTRTAEGYAVDRSQARHHAWKQDNHVAGGEAVKDVTPALPQPAPQPVTPAPSA